MSEYVPGGEIDAETRQFNIWAHQLYIFFNSKFFPAAEKFRAVRTAVLNTLAARAASQIASTSVEVIVEESAPQTAPDAKQESLYEASSQLQPSGTSQITSEA